MSSRQLFGVDRFKLTCIVATISEGSLQTKTQESPDTEMRCLESLKARPVTSSEWTHMEAISSPVW